MAAILHVRLSRPSFQENITKLILANLCLLAYNLNNQVLAQIWSTKMFIILAVWVSLLHVTVSEGMYPLIRFSVVFTDRLLLIISLSHFFVVNLTCDFTSSTWVKLLSFGDISVIFKLLYGTAVLSQVRTCLLREQ